MSKVIERNKMYLVQSQHGSYSFNNKKTAEKLNKQLNTYENTIQTLKQQLQLQNNHEKLQQHIIALQMELYNAQSDIDKIKELTTCTSK